MHSQPLAMESLVGSDHLLARSRATRALAAAACLKARAQSSAARDARLLAAAQRARAAARRSARKRRVVVYLADPVELARACRQLTDLDCEIVATSDLSRAAAEIASDRTVDLLITEETLAAMPRPRLLH